MNTDEQLLKNLRKIDTNLNNNLIRKEVLNRDNGFDYEALRDSIKSHITSIDLVDNLESEEYSDLVDNASILAEVTSNGVSPLNINQFFNAAAYFTKERQEKIRNDENFEIKKNVAFQALIDKNEFESRYRKLVSLLLDISGGKSNLTLFTESEGRRFKLFRQGENLAVQPSTDTQHFTITLKHLLQIAYDNKKATRSYDTVIIKKIMTDSVFDFIDLTVDQNDEYLANRLDKSIKTINEQIKNLQSSKQHMELQKQLSQAKTLFDEAASSKDKIDAVLAELKNENAKALADLDSAKHGEIAYFLSKQFENKTVSLKALADGHEKKIFNWIVMIFMLAIWLLVAYFSAQNIVDITLDFSSLTAIFMIFAVKLPLVFMVFFHLNEYSKAKKLYEEYENKRIMAATLVNSLNRIKAELQVDTKELIEIIKTPMERIFDNPVHSIYGDKSGDKNSMKDMLEQFDKLSNIMEKMKK